MRVYFGFLLILAVFFTNLSAQNKTMSSLLDNVLISDVEVARVSANSLLAELENKNAATADVRNKFANLIRAWRSVEAIYIAGDLDEDLLDLPRLVDIFHEGNEDIKEHMARVVASSDEPAVALFKNSYKSINALEYLLHAKPTLSKRQRELAAYVVKNISEHLDEVLQIYQNGSAKLLSDEKWANSAILNALISSSYKLAMWRLGEVLAKTKKYSKVDAKRAEYHLSKLSVEAILAIINTHGRIMDSKFADFGDMALASGAKDEVNRIRALLKEAKALASSMNEEDLVSPKGEQLFEITKKIYLAYALYMVDALSITAKIVEADGD